jgi:hypothetical protein
VDDREAQKEVQNIALDNNFSIPGDPGFPLNQVRYLPGPLPPLLFISSSNLPLLSADVQPPLHAAGSRNSTTVSCAGETGNSEQVIGKDI